MSAYRQCIIKYSFDNLLSFLVKSACKPGAQYRKRGELRVNIPGNDMSKMKFLSVRELQQQGSGIKEILEDDGRIVITSNGKPIGFTVGVDEGSLEEILEDWKRVRQMRHLRFIDRKLDESETIAAEPDAEWISAEAFWDEQEVETGI